MAEHLDHDSNEDHPLIPPVEPTPMTITLVMADRDPPRLPPPPPPCPSGARGQVQAAIPTGAQAMAAQPWPGTSTDEVSRSFPRIGEQTRTQPNMTGHGRQQTVVVMAIDVSEQSDYALDHYLRHLHRPDNRIIFVHSVSSPFLEIDMPSSGSGAPLAYLTTSPDYLRDLLQKKQDHISRVRHHFEQKIRGLPHSLHYSFHFMNHKSTPGESIVDVITRVQPAFVVLGSRGITTCRRTLLGSVTHYVMNHSNVPVFICHQGLKNI